MDPGRRPQDLGEGPIGDSLSVREAASFEHERIGPLSELLDQTRLAHPRLPDHARQATGTGGLLELGTQHGELLAASDQGATEAPRAPDGQRSDRAQSVGGYRLGLALRGDRIDRIDLDRIAHQPEGRLADQDFTGRGCLLEACCRVDRITGHERLPSRRVARDDLTRVDADPERDRRPHATEQLLVQPDHPLLHLPRRTHRPQRVVLVRDRYAENRHHGVPDELLDRPAVTLDRVAHRVEVAEHQLPHRLGVHPLAHRSRPGDVAEEQGRELSPLGSRRRQRGAASRAEAEALRTLPAARTAGRHARSVRPFDRT